ncbi:(2Fe-2S)-binding protein [Blastococcus sp. PRF04-17]|uniref:(2Fe-2S)-binding protein n=1 Tax=Blastococcus sp. PRF04-17 TaxID=2933797 RepID=UPI001FF6C12C|nr:(2Fe-2S)-binding protein [Blastococcus sp. PRF04-17]UOY00069.1 (2Fe-2S)-binding protein [Blastococcus sp. PRF04-17]
MTGRSQAAVAARMPGAAGLGLVAPAAAAVVPGTALADAEWTAMRLRAAPDARVAATVWWYSLSLVLVTPPLAGLLVGSPLSARLTDLSVAFTAGRPVAAVSCSSGGDLGADLRESLSAVIASVAEAGRMRERPLWAIATDSVANQLLALGRAVGDVPRATALAGEVGAAVGPPLPVPRYVDVAGARFTRRASCCLMVELPGGALCTSCPRRPPSERRRLLEVTARGM